MSRDDDLALLRSALEQLGGLLDEVPAEALSRPTPCELWNVQQLIDHIVAAPTHFAGMMRGEPVDWSAATPSAGDDPAAQFRAAGEELLAAWADYDGAFPASVDRQCAELA